MTFLQPWLLAALPLLALPLLIHLVNQRRFQTIEWGAMMFLLAAKRMARGYSRLRQWLIMAMRMLAIAALLLAISRPLASGWLGLAGGKPDTTIILLDRSPSMEQRGAGGGDSKLATGRRQLARALATLGSSHWVLIESTAGRPYELESPTALLDLPSAGPASAPADLPRMLQAAHDYIRDNRAGRSEIWICSDLRENDWTPHGGRWQALRDAFLAFPQGVRIQLLAYPRPAPANLSVRVTDVRRRPTSDGAELLVSFRVAREGGAAEPLRLPVQFEIDGARSAITVELGGGGADFEDRIPLDRERHRGWGRVSLPADANPADDDFYFAFDDPPPRRAILVAEDAGVARSLELAAGISPDAAIQCSAEVVAADKLAAVAWDQIALVAWQGPLPTGAAADLLTAFVDRGGQAVFFPPRNAGQEELFGARWQGWSTGQDTRSVTTWRGDEDLLAHTLSGAALPVGQLEVRRYCGLQGEATALATLPGGAPLLARAPTRRGGVYFWATSTAPSDSSLATSGVVLYAFMQRSLAAGSASLAKVRMVDAPAPADENPVAWNRVAPADETLSTEYAFQRGVYGAGDCLLAVNRPASEDGAKIISELRVAELFRGLDFVRIDERAGSLAALVQEIWRSFLAAMLVGLILEAALCMPPAARAAGAAA